MTALRVRPVKFPVGVRRARPPLPRSHPSYSHVRRPAGNSSAESQTMQKNENKILPFPPPASDPARNTIIAQIGRERFAIRYEFEDLPPARRTPPPPMPLIKPPTQKRKRVA